MMRDNRQFGHQRCRMRNLCIGVIASLIAGCGERSPEAPPVSPPSNTAARNQRSDKEEILDAVLQDLINNPQLKSTREFYGTAEDKAVALVTFPASGVPWPSDYQPVLTGWTVSRVSRVEEAEQVADSPRRLGVMIDGVSEESGGRGVVGSRIAVNVLNAGGSSNGGAFGSCWVVYSAKKVDGNWVVKCEEISDP
jgi:hypothetical protein